MLIRQSPEPARVQGEADLTVSSLGLSLIPLSTGILHLVDTCFNIAEDVRSHAPNDSLLGSVPCPSQVCLLPSLMSVGSHTSQSPYLSFCLGTPGSPSYYSVEDTMGVSLWPHMAPHVRVHMVT